ncbi:MAG: hypothetical protein LBC85_06200 [Fibromonadaceae bacterium]|jgi:hypothetical protein|nr:hypothetical protein [Fibromonadaceae bacterium]
MKKRLFLIIALFVSSLTTVKAQFNANSEEFLRKLVGVWEGSYSAGQGETGLTLTVFEEGGNFKATFDFYNLPSKNNAANGKYYMNVSYNTSTKRYSLIGYEWIKRPRNYGFADLEGTLTGNVFSGSTYDFRVIRIDEVAIAERMEETQRQNTEVIERFYSNLATILNPTLAKKMANLFTEISTNIINENIGTNAQNDVTWRKRWVKRLTDTENMFNTIFSNRGRPYILFYSTDIKQGKINYQTETIELSTLLNLRMNDNWVDILDVALQTVKAMDDKLQGTGRRSDWGLNDWPNTGVSQTNPFRNTYYGGGIGGTTRHGTQWKTDFTIVFELLNDKGRVIGRQSIELSPFFEIYCNNRNYYGKFIESFWVHSPPLGARN